jgi:hypothetical protein
VDRRQRQMCIRDSQNPMVLVKFICIIIGSN